MPVKTELKCYSTSTLAEMWETNIQMKKNSITLWEGGLPPLSVTLGCSNSSISMVKSSQIMSEEKSPLKTLWEVSFGLQVWIINCVHCSDSWKAEGYWVMHQWGPPAVKLCSSPLSSIAHILFKKSFVYWLELRLTSAFRLTANHFRFINPRVSLVGSLQGLCFRTITS